jgi:hypothetical protein
MKLRLNTVVRLLAIALTGLALAPTGSLAQSDGDNPAAGKSYQIRNKQYGDLLRPADANSADGTPIVLYPAQAWKCMTWKFGAAGDSQFSLQNHFTAKTFAAIAGSDQTAAAVKQVPFGKKPEDRPSWQFSKLKDGTYKIADAKTGKVLTAQKSSTGSEVRITLEGWTENTNQKWELQPIDPAKLTM